MYSLKEKGQKWKIVQKLAGLTLKVAWQLCLRLAQWFMKGSCIFIVLAQFAHFSKLRKKRKHCASATSLWKTLRKPRPQLPRHLQGQSCKLLDKFSIFGFFLRLYTLENDKKNWKMSENWQSSSRRFVSNCGLALSMLFWREMAFAQCLRFLRGACAFCAIY